VSDNNLSYIKINNHNIVIRNNKRLWRIKREKYFKREKDRYESFVDDMFFNHGIIIGD